VVSSCVLSGCAKKQAPNMMAMMMMQEVPVRAVAAKMSDVPLEVSAVGNVESLASVDVKSRVAGQVLRVCFQEGDNVRQGQLLFEIDPKPLEEQIAQIQADIGKDVALEQQARANVAKDQAQLIQTKAQTQRALQLQKEGIFSREQTEQVVATNDSTQASLEADQAAVESALASAKSDRARLAQTQLQLTYTKITAPISGRAGAVAVKAGNLVKDSDATLVTLLKISPINVSFGVPQQLLPDIQKYNSQHPLQVVTTSGGATVTGKLDFIDNTVDLTTGTIKLKALFENANQVLWPGQYVDVKARLELERGRVTVPSRTVQNGPQGKYVWVMNTSDKSVAMRPVDVERIYKPQQGGELSVVKDGLKPGEMVISEGQMRLMPGAHVKLLSGESQT
jgi:multidrug efflux system membrane fusion protein